MRHVKVKIGNEWCKALFHQWVTLTDYRVGRNCSHAVGEDVYGIIEMPGGIINLQIFKNIVFDNE